MHYNLQRVPSDPYTLLDAPVLLSVCIRRYTINLNMHSFIITQICTQYCTIFLVIIPSSIAGITLTLTSCPPDTRTVGSLLTDLREAVIPFVSVPCVGDAVSANASPAFLPSGVAPTHSPQGTFDDTELVDGCQIQPISILMSAPCSLILCCFFTDKPEIIYHNIIHIVIIITIFYASRSILRISYPDGSS